MTCRSHRPPSDMELFPLVGCSHLAPGQKLPLVTNCFGAAQPALPPHMGGWVWNQNKRIVVATLSQNGGPPPSKLQNMSLRKHRFTLVFFYDMQKPPPTLRHGTFSVGWMQSPCSRSETPTGHKLLWCSSASFTTSLPNGVELHALGTVDRHLPLNEGEVAAVVMPAAHGPPRHWR